MKLAEAVARSVRELLQSQASCVDRRRSATTANVLTGKWQQVARASAPFASRQSPMPATLPDTLTLYRRLPGITAPPLDPWIVPRRATRLSRTSTTSSVTSWRKQKCTQTYRSSTAGSGTTRIN